MQCPNEYSPIDDARQRQSLEAELQREIAPNHPLYSVPVTALFHRIDDDDVLFQLRDETRRVAEVHLTWRGMQEQLPWPKTIFFDSIHDWIDSYSESRL